MKFHFAKKLVVFLALLWCGAVHAQTNAPGRWLLVFDISSSMKTRLPGTTAALKQFLDTSAGGELREGDSVAVWAYDKVLQRGQNPIEWNPAAAAASGTNLVAWLERLPHLNNSSLAALNPSLGRVVGGSERVTVVIFCDGQSPLNFTPYDDGINQNFRESLAERKKSRQPFVVVLRGQQGKYVGCTVNFPPAGISLPPFPPLPPKPVVVTPPKPATGSQPAATPSLVITGTKVGTNLNEIPAPPTPPPPAPPSNPAPVIVTTAPTNPPVVKVEAKPLPTNVVKPVIVATTPTNPPVTTVIVTQVVVKTVEPVAAPTNPALVAAATENPPPAAKSWLFAVIVSLVLVIVASVIFLRRTSQRPQSSLISSLMEDDSRRK